MIYGIRPRYCYIMPMVFVSASSSAYVARRPAAAQPSVCRSGRCWYSTPARLSSRIFCTTTVYVQVKEKKDLLISIYLCIALFSLRILLVFFLSSSSSCLPLTSFYCYISYYKTIQRNKKIKSK